ncbi:hypothetical protein MNBD_GAMMA26-850 [hydrothermal vent metagenome]|uniref:Uncharacterized protein n=1 Tax=hydrothermal vent metagenome TaxID=652676 RepID=A0A3B1AP87_9ZZZZ
MAIEVLDIIDTAVKIGLGALISGVATYHVTKLKYAKDAEKDINNWLRVERHKAYSKLSKCIMSFSLDGDGTRTPFQDLALFSESALLTENNGLIDELEKFTYKLEKMNRLMESENEEDKKKSEKIYHDIYDDRLELVKRLRDELRNVDS